VAGVLVYNRVQERTTRKRTEQAFGSKHPDALLGEPHERREPTLDAAPAEQASAAAVQADPRIDYLVTLQGVGATRLRPDWGAIERRFGRRASLSEAPGGLQAAFQMVSRKGVVSEAELLEFRTAVETVAASHGATVSAPAMREALEGAQALDRACADVDVQIALHVLGPAEPEPRGEGFSVARREGGLTLLLDVPRTAHLAQAYAAMTQTARRLGGRLVDDNGNALDERALGAIGVEVEALGSRLGEIGIEPGSPLALRLFS